MDGGIDTNLATVPLKDTSISHRQAVELPCILSTMAANLAAREHRRLQQPLKLHPQGNRCPLCGGSIFWLYRLRGFVAESSDIECLALVFRYFLEYIDNQSFTDIVGQICSICLDQSF